VSGEETDGGWAAVTKSLTERTVSGIRAERRERRKGPTVGGATVTKSLTERPSGNRAERRGGEGTDGGWSHCDEVVD